MRASWLIFIIVWGFDVLRAVAAVCRNFDDLTLPACIGAGTGGADL